VNGNCSCLDNGMVYSSDERKCLWRAGFQCNEQQDCTENATCVRDGKGLKLKGECKCNSGFVETESRICEYRLNSTDKDTETVI
jgi:hypothetical protein